MDTLYDGKSRKKMKVTLLAGGGGDIYYELGLCSGLASAGVHVNYIGSDSLKDAEVLSSENVSFYNLRGSQDPNVPLRKKVLRILRYYLRLIKYAWETDSKLFHIQWPNKFVYFDRVLLNTYYKILGKTLIFTAHNVNEGIRDAKDNLFNRLTLKCMYRIMDHIIVHTDKMKQQVIEDFGISESKVSVIPYGINNLVYKSDLSRTAARAKLQLNESERVVLFFGIITPYKGLEYLLYALANLSEKDDSFRLIIAGKIDKGCGKYWESILRIIREHNLKNYVSEKIGYIPDRDIEIYFKAADVLALPYKYIFQSGVLFLAFNFGLPVIATDVGSLREFLTEGRTGFICSPEDSVDLTDKIELYFKSDLFRNLGLNRDKIMKYANERYSWKLIGAKTCALYRDLV